MENNNDLTRANKLFQNVEYNTSNKDCIIVCYELKTPENIGSVIRLASNFGCSKVILVIKDEIQKSKKIKKIAGAAAGQVEIIYCNSTEFWLNLPNDYETIAVETAVNSENIIDAKFDRNIVLIFGNEVKGLNNDTVAKCDRSVFIPMFGKIKSMNVSHACAVALYAWRSKT